MCALKFAKVHGERAAEKRYINAQIREETSGVGKHGKHRGLNSIGVKNCIHYARQNELLKQ